MPLGMSKQAWFNVPTEPIVKDGLIFWADAGRDDSYPGSGTAWFDLTENGNDGTLTNGPTYDPANKGSIVFDGVNDFADFGHSSSLVVGNSMSVCAWFNVGSTASYQVIASKVGSLSGVFTGWELANSFGRLRVTIRGTTNIDRYGPSNGLSGVGDWYMGSFTYTNTPETKLYTNETLNNTHPSGTATHDTTYPLRIGRRELNFGFYNGKISQVLIYDRVLSIDEISQNFNALRGRYGI